MVTSFDDGDPSNPLWYVRQTDKDFSEDKELSSLDVSMYIQASKTFPTSQEDIKTYWHEATKYRPYQPEPTIEPLSIDSTKGWEILEFTD